MKKGYRIKDADDKMVTYGVRGEEVGRVDGQDGKLKWGRGEKRKSIEWRQRRRREGRSVTRRDCDESERELQIDLV
jgi:NADPH-dependent ferric siderophore reductase